MRIRSVIPAVIIAAALASGCAEDTPAVKADRPAGQSASPAVEKASTSDAAGARAGGEKASGRQKPSGRQTASAGDDRKTSGNGKQRPAAGKDSTSGRRPTARQIADAIQNQGEQQVDDLSPRLKRLRAIGAERQGAQQKPRKLSPEEQRAFEIGSESPEYQD